MDRAFRRWALTLALLANLAGGCLASSWALDREELTNIAVYESVAPAVVTITVNTPEGPSSGAGAIVDATGVIITSSHVIGEALTGKVTLDSGEEYPVRMLARVGASADLAILKVSVPRPLPFVKMGQSSSLRVGQKVLAIGNPYGFDRTLTLGIVSRLDKERNRIQTDASINPGNSGGPLLNTDGEMIGISQSIFNPDGRRTNIGIGFAVPVDSAREFIREVARMPLTGEHTALKLPVEVPAGQDKRNIPVLLQAFTE